MKQMIYYIFLFFVLIVFQFKALGESYYEFLGVSPEASQEKITKAYRRFAQKWHPDKNPAPESSEMFKKAANIYETLSDLYKRKMYDSSLQENLSEDIPSAENFEDINILSIEEFLEKYPITRVRRKIVSRITNLKQLEIVMADPDPEVRRDVVNQARKIPKGMKIINYLSNDPDESVRVSVVHTIGRMKHEYHSIINESIIDKQIDKFMKDPSSSVKRTLVFQLSNFIYDKFRHPEKIFMKLNTLMRDPDPEVRSSVAENASRMKNEKESVMEILNYLKNDPNQTVKRGVIEGALEKLGGSSAEEILDHFMKDPDPSVRIRIVKSLTHWIGGLIRHNDPIKSTVERLKVLMKDPDSEVRRAVAENADGVNNDESAIEILNYLKNDPDPQVREEVAKNAGRMFKERTSVLEILNYLKNDPTLEVKKGVITGAVRLGGSSAEEILDHFMKDPDPSIRIRIANSIVGSLAVKRLRVLMRDPDPEVRRAVAENAVRMIEKGRAVRKILYTLSKDKDPRVVNQVFRSALSLKGKQGMNFIYRRLRKRAHSNQIVEQNDNQYNQFNAKERIEEALNSGGGKAEEVLDHFMKDPDPDVRVHVVENIIWWSSGDLRIRSAVERLKVLMKDPDPKVRRAVAESAGRMKSEKESAIEILNYLKNDPSPKVKKGVITGAVSLGGSSAEEIIDHFMKDSDPNIRADIANSIISFSGDLRIINVVEYLKVLMKDPDPEVRVQVARSAGRMESEKESAIEILNYLKNDPILGVKEGVITGAVWLGGSSAEEMLDHFMKDFDLETKKDVIIHPAELREIKVETIQNLDSSIREHIAGTIIGGSGDLKVRSAVERLKVLMRDPDPNVRTQVARSAGRMESEKESAIEILNYLKNDPIPRVKAGVITGAVELGGSLAEEMLDHFMKDPDPDMRVHIVNTIIWPFGDLRVRSAIERLRVLMRDPDPRVRKQVARYIDRLKDYNKKEELVEILIVLGNDRDFSIVVEVVESALSLGRETTLAVLTSILLNNKNPQVQEYIGPIARKHLGREAYQKLLSDSSCAASLSVN